MPPRAKLDNVEGQPRRRQPKPTDVDPQDPHGASWSPRRHVKSGSAVAPILTAYIVNVSDNIDFAESETEAQASCRKPSPLTGKLFARYGMWIHTQSVPRGPTQVHYFEYASRDDLDTDRDRLFDSLGKVVRDTDAAKRLSRACDRSLRSLLGHDVGKVEVTFKIEDGVSDYRCFETSWECSVDFGDGVTLSYGGLDYLSPTEEGDSKDRLITIHKNRKQVLKCDAKEKPDSFVVSALKKAPHASEALLLVQTVDTFYDEVQNAICDKLKSTTRYCPVTTNWFR